jgi:hypothetical protein
VLGGDPDGDLDAGGKSEFAQDVLHVGLDGALEATSRAAICRLDRPCPIPATIDIPGSIWHTKVPETPRPARADLIIRAARTSRST